MSDCVIIFFVYGKTESQRPNGMGRADEQHPKPGDRDRKCRTDFLIRIYDQGRQGVQLSAAFSCIRRNYVRIFQAQRKHRSPMGDRRISTQHTIPKQQTIIAHGSFMQSHIIAASSAPVMWYPIHSSMVRIVKQSIIINGPFSVAL